MKMIVWCVFVLGAVYTAGKVVVTHVGQTVLLDCGVNTFVDQLAWFQKDNLVIRVNAKSGFPRRGSTPVVTRSTLKLETKLQITGVTKEDGGKFRCEADQKTYHHTLVVISMSVVPSRVLQLGSVATLQCQAKGLEPSSLVQWRRPTGQLTSSDEVQLKSVARLDSGIWQCVFSWNQEMFSENITITVEVPTTSPPVILNNSEAPRVTDLPAKDGDMQLLGLSWWVWLALGAGCLVLVLLLVLSVILCQRIRRKKNKFVKMKNVQQPLRPRKYCNCDRPTAAAKPQQGRRREKPSAPPL